MVWGVDFGSRAVKIVLLEMEKYRKQKSMRQFLFIENAA